MKIKVLDKAFGILEYIALHNGKPVLPNEIHKEMQLPQPTCVRLLTSLVELGYLDRLSRQKGYVLGPLAYHLSGGRCYQPELQHIARPLLDKFAEQTGQSCQLSFRHSHFRVIPYGVNAPNGVKLNSSEFRYDDLAVSLAGCLLLSSMSEPEIDKFITDHGVPLRYPWSADTTRKSLLKELKELNRAGIIRGSRHEQGIFAAAIYADGRIVAALGTVWDEHFVKEPEPVIESLIAVAQKITREISSGSII